jgi:carbamoyltransferase
MIILGINDTHDASACLIKDGKLLIAVEEERFRRVKKISSFPRKSIENIFKFTGYSSNDIDLVAVGTKSLNGALLWNTVADFKIDDWKKLQEELFYNIIYKKKKISFKETFKDFKPSVKLGYPLKGNVKIELNSTSNKDHLNQLKIFRKKYISKFLKIDENKINFYDHHLCHSLYGYFVFSKYLKKKKNIAIVSMDGGGDKRYNSINIINNLNFKSIKNNSKSLIGPMYESITLLLGMNPAKHSYKVMGLAPYASEYHKSGPRKIFLDSFKIRGINFFRSKKMKDYYTYFKKKLNNYRFDGISGGIQDFVEIRLAEWFQNISKKYKVKNFVFSGGVANNVKANKYLFEKKFIDQLYVPPGPGDESISIGAAFASLVEKEGFKKTNSIAKFPSNAYWGVPIDKEDLIKFKNNLIVKKNYKQVRDEKFKHTSYFLSKGEIIFFCKGRMEFGQRALGHRSILTDPSNIESVYRINSAIKKRDFWMPFTPSVLDSHKNKYFLNPKKINCDFMTMSFDTTKLGKKHLKAAIHPYDHTIRPQIVTKKTCSHYHSLISEFKKLTGIGALLNTSLNVHDKPIICQPTDLIKELISDKDTLANFIYIEDTLFIKKIK